MKQTKKVRNLNIGGFYKHYRGTIVKVLSVVKHSETLEDMVHYIHLGDGFEWVRPKIMFLDKIDKNTYRFTEYKQELKIHPANESKNK